MGILAVVATLAAGLYVCSRLWAEPYGSQPSALRTRIAVINLGQVVKNYVKFKNFEEELKKDEEWYQKQYEEKRAQIVQREGKLKDPATSADDRERYTREITILQRQIQDLADDGKKKVGKKQFDAMVQTFKEVHDAAAIYAKNADIDLVLHYNDGIGEDAYNPMIFSRKLANGACMPMYVAPGMDITDAVTQMLNRNVASVGTPPSNYHN
jgi:Skp family chaperone for outer membrane proteins